MRYYFILLLFFLGCGTDDLSNSEDSKKSYILNFNIEYDDKRLKPYYTYHSQEDLSYKIDDGRIIHLKAIYPNGIQYHNPYDKRKVEVKKGAIVEILFKKDRINDYYKIQPTILKFKHNLKNSNIKFNTISTKTKDRLTPMSIKFVINQDVDIDLLLTRPISIKSNIYCPKRETKHLKLYTLDELLEKDSLYKEVYKESGTIYTNFDARNIEDKYLLVECYNENNNLKYQGILDMSRDDFWNFSEYATAFYKANAMTDFYYHGIKSFTKKNFSFKEAKKESEKITRDIFSHYPTKWGIGEVKTYGDNIRESNDFLSNFNLQLDFIQNYKNITSSIIFDELEKYLFGDLDMNRYIKAHFFPDTLNIIANEETEKWYELRNITTDRTGGTIQVVKKNSMESVLIDFESNRGKEEPASQIALVQDINIENINKNNLYFRTEINRIEGLPEETIGPNCSGLAGISLAYLDKNNNIIGNTLLANMTDSMASKLDGTGILTNAITLDGNESVHVIRLEKTKYNKLVIDINFEINQIKSIQNIDIVKKIRIYLFTSDFFTDGPYLNKWVGIAYPSCYKAKAFLDVSKVGIYNYEN